jgi:predicted transcriptional regulator
MGKIKKLPDAEFEIMKVIWQSDMEQITTNQIIAALGDGDNRKPQTVLTLLVRLIERGFLNSEKVGKERTYAPLVDEQDYLQTETASFIEKYHKNSLSGLVKTLYNGKNLSDEEIRELRELLDGKE